jgi:hypothetical protein
MIAIAIWRPKVTKGLVSRRLLYAHGHAAQSRQNHGLQPFAPLSTLLSLLLQKLLCPSRRAALHVLPAFGRSFLLTMEELFWCS